MHLSEPEEQVLAALERQFEPGVPDAPRPTIVSRVLCLVTAGALFLAAGHAALVIFLADVFGFSTEAVRWALTVPGHLMLLLSAFLMGRAWGPVRARPTA